MSENSKKSFSMGVKEELLKEMPSARHCRIAEIAAMTSLLGLKEIPLKSIEKESTKTAYFLGSDSKLLREKYFTLLEKTINITECANRIWGDEFAKLKELLKFNGEGEFAPVNDILLQQECCRKAFLRGAFLSAGSVNDPQKSYHLEITSDNEALSKQIYEVFFSLGIPARVTKRKSHYVVYIKEGTLIVDALGVMGAPLRLMELENVRILKGMRNDLNRKVNCEAANIKKTIDAAMAQIEDINYIDEKIGIFELPDSLSEVARLRRLYPEKSLVELGEMLTPTVGKSGVNHRLRRISRMAEDMRKEEDYNEEGRSS